MISILLSVSLHETVWLCVLHLMEFIYEAFGELLDLVNIKVGRFLSEGDALRCVQHKEKINRTFCSRSKQTSVSEIFRLSYKI